MLSRWQSTIVDERGNVQPLANLTVRNESDQSLAKMWASPGTTQPLPDGMVQADGNGYAFFYARGGLYRITSVALGIDWRHVQIGAALVSIGDYAAGLEITERNQIFWRDGELYRAGAVLELPYTTTGDWGDEEGLFVAVGDAALRQDLAGEPVAGMGALLVRGAVVYVDTIDEMKALPASILVDRQQIRVNEYTSGTGVGGGCFYWDSEDTTTPNGGTVIESAHSLLGRFRRVGASVSPEDFGCDNSGTYDCSDQFVEWLNASGYNKNAINGSRYLISKPIYPVEFCADFSHATIIVDHDLAEAHACLNLPNRHILRNVNITSSDPSVDRDAVFTANGADDDVTWHNVSFYEIGGRGCNSTANNHKITGTLSMKDCQQSQDFEGGSDDPVRPRGALRFAGNDLTIDKVLLSGGRSRALALSSCNRVAINTIFSSSYDAGGTGEFFYLNNCTEVYVGSVYCGELTSTGDAQLLRLSRACSDVKVKSLVGRCLGAASGVRIFGGVNIEIDYDIYVENARCIYVADHARVDDDDWPARNIKLNGSIISDGNVRIVEVVSLDGQVVDNITISGYIKCNGGRESEFRPGAVNLVNTGYTSYAENLVIDFSDEVPSALGSNEGIHCRAICTLKNIKTVQASAASVHGREGEVYINGAELNNIGGNGIHTHTSCEKIWARGIVSDGLLNMSNAVSSVLSFSEARAGNNAATTFQNWSGT